ncbi:MAG: hypothetical protein NTW99_07840 [Chloroflexi bacterium]|nr:hypothetical protein [Chloroflexota bacterium]
MVNLGMMYVSDNFIVPHFETGENFRPTGGLQQLYAGFQFTQFCALAGRNDLLCPVAEGNHRENILWLHLAHYLNGRGLDHIHVETLHRSRAVEHQA